MVYIQTWAPLSSLPSYVQDCHRNPYNEHNLILFSAISVHAVAGEIAKIHNINLDKIISKLTEVRYVILSPSIMCSHLCPPPPTSLTAMASVHHVIKH